MTKTNEPSAEDLSKVIAIAASAGGLEPIIGVISGLPSDFPAPVLIVQHMSPGHESHLPEIIGKYTSMKVKEVEEGDKLNKATIYTAKPDRHMIVNSDGTLSLGSTDPVQYTRPAADVLFVTMAISCREKAIAVILSGAGKDGAIGSLAVKRAGGKTIVQEDPQVSGMPEAAIKIDDVDYIEPLAKIAPLLVELVIGGKPR